jgi:hypothetical protein
MSGTMHATGIEQLGPEKHLAYTPMNILGKGSVPIKHRGAATLARVKSRGYVPPKPLDTIKPRKAR